MDLTWTVNQWPNSQPLQGQVTASRKDSSVVFLRPNSLRLAISPRTARLSSSSGSKAWSSLAKQWWWTITSLPNISKYFAKHGELCEIRITCGKKKWTLVEIDESLQAASTNLAQTSAFSALAMKSPDGKDGRFQNVFAAVLRSVTHLIGQLGLLGFKLLFALDLGTVKWPRAAKQKNTLQVFCVGCSFIRWTWKSFKNPRGNAKAVRVHEATKLHFILISFDQQRWELGMGGETSASQEAVLKCTKHLGMHIPHI